jgi:hypothetical protein
MIHVITVVAFSMLLAAGAQAQTPCDQLKGVLAARIDAAGALGYNLETVPAGTPVPPGAKVVGTCEGGTSKILYRRGGAARPTAHTPEAAHPASTARATNVLQEQARRPPGVEGDRSSRPTAVPASSPAQRVISQSTEATFALAQPQPTLPERPAATEPPAQEDASGFMADHWPWVGALVFALLAAAIWGRHAYFSACDKTGLPRGRRRGTAQQAARRLQALQMRRGLDQPR